MKKIAIILAVFLLLGLGAGVFAKDLFVEETANRINDELVPLGSSEGTYDDMVMEQKVAVASGVETPVGNLDINSTLASKGVVAVRFDYNGDKKIKVTVEKEDSKIHYNYLNKGEYEFFPLAFGEGTYRVSIMENTEGNRYRVVEAQNIEVRLDNENLPFLGSVQPVNWSQEDGSSRLADQLTQGLETDSQKFMAIYRYVVENLYYDSDKISGLDHTYVPDNAMTLETGSGICYDYASLLASMLRSVGIPTKLVKGYGDFQPDVYHAWNEVLLDGQWIVVDTSYDSQQLKKGRSVDVVKDPESYGGIYAY